MLGGGSSSPDAGAIGGGRVDERIGRSVTGDIAGTLAERRGSRSASTGVIAGTLAERRGIRSGGLVRGAGDSLGGLS